ncbi:hypothetical protein EAH79_17085 [Sphingomonas koreensis]|nr:hypothetical protein EAH79_17085 [Sphingomonas koreensis]
MMLSMPLELHADSGLSDSMIDLRFENGGADGLSKLGPRPTFHTQFAAPEFVPGVTGRAWRSDGFSSWISVPLKLPPSGGFAVEAWVALASFPSDVEGPVADIKPASFVEQATRDAGFDLFIDEYGRWGFRVSTESGNHQTLAPDAFPLNRWVNVAATFDPVAGKATLYLDGKPIGQTSTGAGKAFRSAATDLRIARSWQDADLGIFDANGLNGAFDNVQVVGRALTPQEIGQNFASVSPPLANASLVVPTSRFASDLQRPTYHALPPANWTNEPHGLVRRGNEWHLFYQRTPNGPYKTEMHWGHMMSRNLVNWTYLPDALWPTLQTDNFGFDQKGIWSGDVVIGPHGIAYAFYTSVNQSSLFNPGISVALSADPELRTWRKRGPIIDDQGLRDFRDPYVWYQDGEWRMVVGAAMPGKGGGVAYYTCNDIDDTKCWKKQPRIAPFDKMDVGSDIWEMPVFESIGEGKYILEANPVGADVSKYGEKATRAVYWIGTWDGKRFRPDDLTPKMLDLIPGHLSPTVDRDADGQLVGIGIVDERRSTQAQKDAGWAHTFSLPRVWRLLGDGKTLGQSPWPGLNQLRDVTRHISGTVAAGAREREVGDLGRAAELKADFGNQLPTTPYGVFLAASPDRAEVTRLIYDPASHVLALDKSKSTLSKDGEGPMVLSGAYDEATFGKPRSFHVYIDHSVVDVFINDAAACSFRIYPTRADSTRFGVITSGNAEVQVAAWPLNQSRFTWDLASK